MLFPNMTSVRIAVIWERERVSQILRDYEAPPPYEPGGGMPSDTALLRWNTLPLEAKRQLAPMVEDEQIQLCWGTLLLGADDPVLHAIDAFSWARGRGEQRDELLVAEGLQSVLAQCVRGPGGPAFGVGPEEVAAVVSLIYGEARRDARTAFNAGSPTFHVVSQALVDERGQACAKRYRDVPPSLIAVWSEIYPLLFSIHFSTLTGQGGDEPDYLDESTLWYFSEEELHAYTHNVLCAAVAMDYRAWLAGKEQSFYHHPNSSFARQQGNFGFLAMIGEEGWAEIQPGQTAGDLPLAHQALLWRGDKLLERFVLVQGELMRSAAYEECVPVLQASGPYSLPEMVNLERAHRYFSRRSLDSSRVWIVVPLWAAPTYDGPWDYPAGGHGIIPTWLVAPGRVTP